MMRRLVLPLAFVARVSPAGAQQVADPPAGLRSLGTTVVEETDTLFLTRPASMVLGSGGHAYLVEVGEARVLDVGPTGRIERVFGRQGQGPGEFRTPANLALSGDTLLAVYDAGQKRLALIDTRRWSLVHQTTLLAGRPQPFVFDGSDLLMPHWDHDARQSVARASTANGAFSDAQGSVPAIVLRMPLLLPEGAAFPDMALGVSGNRVFAMYEVASSLYTWTRTDRQVREIPLPIVRRRGTSDEYFAAILRDPTSLTPASMFDRSIPVLIAPVASDVIGVVTMDAKVEGQEWHALHHLTLYDQRTGRVCPDLPIPAAHAKGALMKDPLPIVAIRGDTLALLERVGNGTVVLRRFRVQPTACADWRTVP